MKPGGNHYACYHTSCKSITVVIRFIVSLITIVLYRHTNLRNLFATPIIQQHSNIISKDLILPYINQDCIHSHIIFIDGIYSSSLSDLTHLPADVVASTLQQMSGTQITDLVDSLSYAPDMTEKPRDSFASDTLSAINMVIHFILLVIYLLTYTLHSPAYQSHFDIYPYNSYFSLIFKTVWSSRYPLASSVTYRYRSFSTPRQRQLSVPVPPLRQHLSHGCIYMQVQTLV